MVEQFPETISKVAGIGPLALGEELLRVSGEVRFVAQGGSMAPAIFPGDVLLVRREPWAQIRRDDVVLFVREGRWFAHRVVRAANEDGRTFFVTRGDALAAEDPAVSGEALLGRVTAVRRGHRWIALRRSQTARPRPLRWAVRQSDSVLKLLLRWNALRKFLVPHPGNT
jgi:signal peptidase I